MTDVAQIYDGGYGAALAEAISGSYSDNTRFLQALNDRVQENRSRGNHKINKNELVDRWVRNAEIPSYSQIISIANACAEISLHHGQPCDPEVLKAQLSQAANETVKALHNRQYLAPGDKFLAGSKSFGAKLSKIIGKMTEPGGDKTMRRMQIAGFYRSLLGDDEPGYDRDYLQAVLKKGRLPDSEFLIAANEVLGVDLDPRKMRIEEYNKRNIVLVVMQALGLGGFNDENWLECINTLAHEVLPSDDSHRHPSLRVRYGRKEDIQQGLLVGEPGSIVPALMKSSLMVAHLKHNGVLNDEGVFLEGPLAGCDYRMELARQTIEQSVLHELYLAVLVREMKAANSLER
ncbi:MAG: hypothetical protein SFX19_10475 [Alphaproteobacteria bacterium]|nr:hypothetical protein [Alphaproteobacteria bacterium]